MIYDQPRKAGHHCRHYSYEISGPGRSGPHCAIGKIGAAPGASSCCDFRQENTDEERAAWRAWCEGSISRLANAVAALPKAIPPRTSGAVTCPSCGQELRYSRWEGGAMIACTTRFCVEARFNIARGTDWPAGQPELIP